MVPRAPMGLHGHYPSCTPPRLWEVIEPASAVPAFEANRQAGTGSPEIPKESCRDGNQGCWRGALPPCCEEVPSASPSSRTHSQTGASEVAAKTFPFSLPIRISASPLPGRQAARPSRPRSVLSAGPQAGQTAESQVTERPLSCVHPQCGEPHSGFGPRQPLGGAGWPGPDKPDDVA